MGDMAIGLNILRDLSDLFNIRLLLCQWGWLRIGPVFAPVQLSPHTWQGQALSTMMAVA